MHTDTKSLRQRSDTRWLNEAPCADTDGFILPEGARSTDKAHVRRARTRMALCRTCPFRVECIAHVQPSQSRFDGICGGRLWINGTAVCRVQTARNAELAEPKLRATCGTDTAWLQHQRHDEKPCGNCQIGKRLADQAKKRRPTPQPPAA